MAKQDIEEIQGSLEEIESTLEVIQEHLERIYQLLEEVYLPGIGKVWAIETMLANFFSLMRHVDIPDSRLQ